MSAQTSETGGGVLDEWLKGGGKTFFTREDAVGRSVTGVVTAFQMRQVSSFETGKPEFWDDGQPKRQAVITLATAERDPLDPEDDGARNVYVKWWGDHKRALIDQARSLAVGDTLTVTFTGVGKAPGKGLNAPKVYEFRLVKGTPVAAAMAAEQPPTPTPTPPPAWATGEAQQQPAPASAPAAPAQPATGEPDLTKVAALRAVGVTDEQIAAAIGATVAQVQGV